MAKRHKNKGHKGNSHGRGLSKSRGTSRGGSRGGMRGGGRGGSAIGGSRDFPELTDLENYASDYDSGKSMKLGSKRPGRLADEVGYTNRHMGETLSRQLRKNPISFVKAKEVYDPSADLFKKLKEVQPQSKEIATEVHEEDEFEVKVNVSNNDEEEEFEVSVNVSEDDEDSDDIRVPFSEIHDYEYKEKLDDDLKDKFDMTPEQELSSMKIDVDEEESQESKPEQKQQQQQEQLYFTDETGDQTLATSLTMNKENLPSKAPVQISILAPTISVQGTVTEPSCLEFDPTFSIGNVFLNSKVQLDGSLQANLPSVKNNYKAAQEYIQQVMQTNNFFDDNEEDDMDSSEEEFIMNAADLEEEEEEEEEEISKGALKIQDLSILDSSKEPEYGFMEEDYLFDVSSITITNVRLSAELKQFYLRSFKVLGIDDFIWIDGDDLAEFLIDNGMASHRVEAYYKFVMKEMGLEEDPKETSNYSDVYISETSEEEEEEEEEEKIDHDEDGLDTLIEYTKRGKIFLARDNDEIPPTETLKTRGKSSKKRLDLNHLDDLSLIESLQDQYIAHKKSRKDKKQATLSRVDEYDMLKKFEYVMHIRDIKQEFEEFLHDGNRNALTFPPFDPHGLKTIKKLAGFYNMKSRKFGKGLKTHMVVIKSKRTFHNLPYYNDINHIMGQRPIFNRIDVRRSLEEVAISKDGAKTRRGVPSKLHAKEGDIVGDHAPEIGQENIGRKLLEKLGWNKGEGLGIDNKGISEPIVAKIKNTKLGIK